MKIPRGTEAEFLAGLRELLAHHDLELVFEDADEDDPKKFIIEGSEAGSYIKFKPYEWVARGGARDWKAEYVRDKARKNKKPTPVPQDGPYMPAMYCGHANECPTGACNCPDNCYCKGIGNC